MEFMSLFPLLWVVHYTLLSLRHFDTNLVVDWDSLLLTNELRWDADELANGKVRLGFPKTDLLAHVRPYLHVNLTPLMTDRCQFKHDFDNSIIITVLERRF